MEGPGFEPKSLNPKLVYFVLYSAGPWEMHRATMPIGGRDIRGPWVLGKLGGAQGVMPESPVSSRERGEHVNREMGESRGKVYFTVSTSGVP